MNPFIMIRQKCSGSTTHGSITQIFHNELLSDLIGIKNPILMTDNKGFDVFSQIKTTNWVNFWLIWISFYLNLYKCNMFCLPNDLVKVVQKDNTV